MEAVYNTLFYILCIFALAGAICSQIFSNVIWSVCAAVVVFWAVGGIYFMLNSPYLGAVQILLWGVGVAILLMFGVMLIKRQDNENCLDNSKPKRKLRLIVSALIVLVFLIIIGSLTFDYALKNDILYVELSRVAAELFENAVVAFELVGILLLAAVVGIGALFLTKKINKNLD